jgi:glycosyltransferase involved in cell wall biosynthesis
MDVWPDVAEGLGAVRKGTMLSRALHGLARRLHARADAVISLGPAMSRLLAERGASRRRLVTVHNWVPAEAVQPRPWGRSYIDRPGLDGRFVAMYCGNMGMGHEFDTFLEAAALLRDDPQMMFLFVGGGRRRAQVQEHVRQGALANVCFADPVPLGELSDLLASARVHLLSMRPEADGCLVPSKLYGILAAARPCVMVGPRASDAGRLVQESGCGVVVAPGDAEQLARALRRLKDRPQEARRMGRAGRRHYEQALGRDRSVERIVRTLLPEQQPCP